MFCNVPFNNFGNNRECLDSGEGVGGGTVPYSQNCSPETKVQVCKTITSHWGSKLTEIKFYSINK